MNSFIEFRYQVMGKIYEHQLDTDTMFERWKKSINDLYERWYGERDEVHIKNLQKRSIFNKTYFAYKNDLDSYYVPQEIIDAITEIDYLARSYKCTLIDTVRKWLTVSWCYPEKLDFRKSALKFGVRKADKAEELCGVLLNVLKSLGWILWITDGYDYAWKFKFPGVDKPKTEWVFVQDTKEVRMFKCSKCNRLYDYKSFTRGTKLCRYCNAVLNRNLDRLPPDVEIPFGV